jgi:hypothetical protein
MIYMHVGVHKTATTYLQSLLAANQGKMAAAGRAYWILWQIRGVLQDLQADRYWTEAGVQHLRTHASSPLFRLRGFTEAASDCLISDENIVGLSTQATGGQFYPEAAKRLRRIRAVLPDKDIEVWLCVRAYDQFLSSVYCETLRGGHFTPWQDFAKLYDPLPPERWPALVDAIHASLPRSRVVIWAYEDFRSLLPQIASRLSGIPYDQLHQLSNDERASPSGEAIRRHCEKAASMTSNQRTLSVAMYEELYPLKSFPEKFNPWRREVTDTMRSTYREDLELIKARPYVEFLTAA